MTRVTRLLWTVPLLLAMTACGSDIEADSDVGASTEALTHRPGQIVSNWVEQSLQTVREQPIGTAFAGRLYAMTTVAMYDAVNGIDLALGRGYEPALVAPPNLPPFDVRDTSAASIVQGAAAASAAHAVLVALSPARARALNRALSRELAALGGGPLVEGGQIWGAYVGNRVVELRSNDGTQQPMIIPAGSGIGEHRADFDARFANMTPFGVANASNYLSPPPPSLTSRAYADSFNDVKRFGRADGNAERDAIGIFWTTPAGTVVETGMWFLAALSIVDQEDTTRSISDTARLFALLGMAIADSVVASWDSKAEYFTWRPTFAIHEADADGNRRTEADPNWTSRFGAIGGSPEYTSGTSTFAGAASRVFEHFYGTRLSFCFEADLGEPRCYDSPLEGAQEAGRSRIYQGIHFQFANVEGLRIGRALANEIVTTRLRRVR